MITRKGKIIVGILGQWASGKSTASKTLIRYLGGTTNVVFLNDQDFLMNQAVNHFREREDSEVKLSIEEDGRQRLEDGLATLWLGPGEDLETVDLTSVHFTIHTDAVLWDWINKARVEVGYEIRKRFASGKPIVVEAAFGIYKEPSGESPFSHSISELFSKLKEAGLEPNQIRWIIVEAGYDRRSERNKSRRVQVPVEIFERYALDGGDLDPDHQKKLEEQGTIIKRVPNDHDDIERFRADIIAAFEELF
jgi:hypothetical protein